MNYITETDKTKGFLIDLSRLHQRLSTLTDNRAAKGKRYSLTLVLVLLLLAKLCGEDTPWGIAQWGQLRRAQLVRAFQIARQTVPCHNTYRRVLATGIDQAELQRVLRTCLLSPQEETYGQLISIDGKTMRGTIPTGESRGVHLLAAYLPAEGLVLMQLMVDKKENEIKVAPHLLETIDLRDRVVRGDAMLTQRGLSVQILEAGGDYVWTVKGNQPELLADVQEVFDPAPTAAGWGQTPRDLRVGQTVNMGHGRIEKRTLTASSFLNDYCDWPGLAQVFQLKRQVTYCLTGETQEEVTYGITSLSAETTPPDKLLAYVRGYWGIENGLHYRRDKTLREDATRISHPKLAEAMAIVNNWIVGFVRQQGFDNLAAARRFFNARIDEAFALSEISFSKM